MHYKLDSRYRHILLDEFQDTNPLQWLTLKSWFEAAAGADMRPTVFMVGDPKQSIYRFRRAEARLFGQARVICRRNSARTKLPQRRVAPLPAAGDRCRQPPVRRRGRVRGVRNARRALPRQARPCGGAAAGAGRCRAGARSRHRRSSCAIRWSAPLARRGRPAGASARREMLVRRSGRSTASWQVATDLKGEKYARRRLPRHHDPGAAAHASRDLRARAAPRRIPFVTSRHGRAARHAGGEGHRRAARIPGLAVRRPQARARAALADVRLRGRGPDGDRAAGGKENEGTWWERLQRLASRGMQPGARARPRTARRAGSRAPTRLRCTTSSTASISRRDVMERYAAAVPEAMRGAVLANLQAFMQRALDTDSGRYPSLPRFLHELVGPARGARRGGAGRGHRRRRGQRGAHLHRARRQGPASRRSCGCSTRRAGQDASRGYDALRSTGRRRRRRRARFSMSTEAKTS